MNSILKLGKDLYEKSRKEHDKKMLTLAEVENKFEVNGVPYEVTVERVNMNDNERILSVHTVKLGLEHVFKEYNRGIISINNQHVIMFKSEKKYYLFDPNGRGKLALNCRVHDTEEREAVLIESKTINDLAEVFVRNFGNVPATTPLSKFLTKEMHAWLDI